MRDPSVSFYKPFQSGEGVCYPTFPWNYYDTKYTPMYDGKMNGGKKTTSKSRKGGKAPVSYANGVDGVRMTELDLKANFGPFLYPPTQMPMNPQSGGKKRGRKSQKGGTNMIGAQYATQPLVPTNPSTPADYVGDAYLKNANQKMALTGSGVPEEMNPLSEDFLSNNMGITYATQAGGAKKKPAAKKKTKKPAAKKPAAKKTTTKRKVKKGGAEYDERLTGSNSPRNMDSNTQCGGRRKNKRGGDKEMDERADQLESAQGQFSGVMRRANLQTGGMDILYRDAGKVNTPSNFSSGDVWHPEWTYQSQKGGRKNQKRGGNYIPTPDAQFSPIPAGAEVQMGMGDHIIKGGPRLKGMDAPINVGNPADPAVQTQMAADTVQMEMDGGAKKRKTTKKTTTKKTTTKKTTTKKPATKKTTTTRKPATKKTTTKKAGQKKKTLKGGVSDFATTLASRGPVNYPDGPSRDLFRFFNKTGTFIPNSQLKFAAAPILTGYSPDPNPYPVAYNEYCGGKPKKTTAAKKKTTAAKKKSADKKKK